MASASPKSRTNRKDSQLQTRSKLIAAARTLFIKHGYGGTSIRDIVEHAGHSQGAFYSNFESKEDILLHLLEQHMHAEAAELQAILDTNTTTLPDTIIQQLDNWSATLNQDIDWCMLSVELQLHANRSPAFAAHYRAVWLQHHASLSRLTEHLFHTLGKKLPIPATELVSACTALQHGLALQKSITGNKSTSGTMMMLFLRSVIAQAENL